MYAPLASLGQGVFQVDTMADSLYHGAAALDSVLYAGSVASMTRRSLVSLSLLAAAGALACSSPAAACIPTPGAYAPGVVVGVADSVTGRPLADTATGTVQSTALSDSLRHGIFPPLDSILVGNVGPGVYTVTVAHPGYASWVRARVMVAADACGAAVTEHLTARLRPAP